MRFSHIEDLLLGAGQFSNWTRLHWHWLVLAWDSDTYVSFRLYPTECLSLVSMDAVGQALDTGTWGFNGTLPAAVGYFGSLSGKHLACNAASFSGERVPMVPGPGLERAGRLRGCTSKRGRILAPVLRHFINHLCLHQHEWLISAAEIV